MCAPHIIGVMAPIDDSFETTGMSKGEMGTERHKGDEFMKEMGSLIIGMVKKQGIDPFVERARMVYGEGSLVDRLVWAGARGNSDTEQSSGLLVRVSQVERPNRPDETICIPVMEERGSGNKYVITPDGAIYFAHISTGFSSQPYMSIENASVKEESSRWQFDPRLTDEDQLRVNMGNGSEERVYPLPGGGRLKMSLEEASRTQIADLVQNGKELVSALSTRGKLATGEMLK